MNNLRVGDIVARKSYGGDVYFKIVDIISDRNGNPVYVLKGMLYRLHADSDGTDLVKYDPRNVRQITRQEIVKSRRYAQGNRSILRLPFFGRFRSKPGRVLHIDADGDFLQTCLKHYADAGVPAVGRQAKESEQPDVVGKYLRQYNPDLLVLTGHDGLKKSSGDLNSLDNYRNSRYYVQSVKEARQYEPDMDKLFVFAGACQSFFQAIMGAGANFASSPGRILINALDPAIVSEKVALTDNKNFVTPQQVAQITISGSEGIGGIKTRGHLILPQ